MEHDRMLMDSTILYVLTCEEALIEGRVRNQRGAHVLNGLLHAIPLRLPVQQRVLHLVGSQRHTLCLQATV